MVALSLCYSCIIHVLFLHYHCVIFALSLCYSCIIPMLFVLSLCYTSVIHVIPVLSMCYSCVIPKWSLYYSCVILALSLCYSCIIPVLFVLSLCYPFVIHIIPVLYIWVTHVLSLCYFRVIPGLFLHYPSVFPLSSTCYLGVIPVIHVFPVLFLCYSCLFLRMFNGDVVRALHSKPPGCGYKSDLYLCLSELFPQLDDPRPYVSGVTEMRLNILNQSINQSVRPCINPGLILCDPWVTPVSWSYTTGYNKSIQSINISVRRF